MTRRAAKPQVTADTITDEQIRELRIRVMSDVQCDAVDHLEVCLLEHRATSPDVEYAKQYRARCAEILNARKAQP